jgi:glycine dehydrogenase
MAVREGLERQMPGRIVGVSIDADGAPALRLALQTREQHIRRDKATSNICTAQVLLAVIASMYAVYHGPDGLRSIAQRVHRFAAIFAEGLRRGGLHVLNDTFFDTVQVSVPHHADIVIAQARQFGINLRRVDGDVVGISFDEVTGREHLEALWEIFRVDADTDELDAETPDCLPEELLRTAPILQHPVFHEHRSETQMLRYLRRLSGKDIALNRSMIPLGSCTMKLNATSEMQAVTRVRVDPSVRAARPDRWLPAPDQRAGALARGDHGLRRGLAAAERRLPRRVRRTAGDPLLPPQPW